jgi:hypothetical protein
MTTPDAHSNSGDEDPSSAQSANSNYDAIALSAYFIALERARRGEEIDPLADWVQAERRLNSAS